MYFIKGLGLYASGVGLVGGVYFYAVALFHEERNLDHQSGFGGSCFGGRTGGIAAQALRSFRNLHLHRAGQIHINRFSIHVEQVIHVSGYQKFLDGLSHIHGNFDRFIGFQIHEIITGGIVVTEFELVQLGVQEFHVFAGAKLDGGTTPGLQVAQGGLNPARATALGAVNHVEDEVGISLVIHDPSLSNIRW